MVSGKLEPKVSGKKTAKTPANKAEPPMIIKGVGSFKLAKSGAKIPPILANIEAVPKAVLRITVGYNSAVYK